MSASHADILIIDDEPANLSLLSSLLTGRGHKVRAVLNGQRGIAAALASPPDLILMDVMMPGMNGYEVCARLKAEPKTSDIPVLFLSALSDTSDKVQAFASGAVDFVTKPFQLEEVLARVETQLALRSLQRQLQQANAELRANLQEVETRNTELAAFAHMVAHDLKNPLGVIMTYGELLGDPRVGNDELERSKWSERIVQLGHRMNSIIDSLLFLAEVRITDLEVVTLDMLALADDAADQLSVPDAGPGRRGRRREPDRLAACVGIRALDHPGVDQLPHQRTQIRRGSSAHHNRRQAAERWERPLLGAGQRSGHSSRGPAPSIRGILPARAWRRDRARPGIVDRPAHHRPAGWQRRRRERAGPGQPLLVLAARRGVADTPRRPT